MLPNLTPQSLNGLLQFALDAVLVVNQQGKVLQANDLAVGLLGYEKREMETMTLIQLFKMPVDLAQQRQTMQVQAKTGEVIPVLCASGAMEAMQGARVLILRDLREEKQWQAKLIHQEKMASLGQVAGGVAHEINNPLAIIAGRLRQLQRLVDTKQEKVADLFQSIHQAVDRITHIVRGLRIYSREGTNDDFSSANIHEIIEDTVGLCVERIKDAAIRVEFQFGPAPLLIACIPSQISQVIMNLYSNAIDAVAGRPDPVIRIEVLEENEQAAVKVIDNGPGIPEAILKKIFDPFFTTKALGKGTGLGLGIVKNIVEHHQGTVYVDRSSSQTCFVVRLPKNQISLAQSA